MASKKSYVRIPYSYLEQFGELTDAEYGALMRALLQYARSGIPITMDTEKMRAAAAWVMQVEDRYQARDRTLHMIRSRAGKAGAEKRWGKTRQSGCPIRQR